MSKITYPNKKTGDNFLASEATEIKESVNNLYDEYNKTELSNWFSKYNYKTVDENNQLNIVMIGDSIFGRQDASDSLELTPNQLISEFPPNMIYKNVAWEILNKYQYNSSDVDYINIQSNKWTKQGTWTKVSNIDNIEVYENNNPTDYVEITVTGCKFFKLVFSTLGSKTLNGVDVTINGVLPSSLGLTGVDSITSGTADIKWANLIWSGLNESTSYTFRFTKNNGAYTSVWGCETWSKPRLNVINSGFGGFTSTEQDQFKGFAQNEYYNADLIVYELPVLNDSFSLTSYGGDIVNPTDARVGGTTEFYFIKAAQDGTYTNFDNLELKEGEIASINSSGVYEFGSVKYEEFKDKYINGLNNVLTAQSYIEAPVLCSSVHKTVLVDDLVRWWGVEYIDYSRSYVAKKGFAFVDVFQYCLDNGLDGTTITSDQIHINTLGVSTWMTVLNTSLEFTFNKLYGGKGKTPVKENGFIDSGDSRTVSFALKYKEAPKVSVNQIGGSNIYIDSITDSGFIVNGSGSFNWSII